MAIQQGIATLKVTGRNQQPLYPADWIAGVEYEAEYGQNHQNQNEAENHDDDYVEDEEEFIEAEIENEEIYDRIDPTEVDDLAELETLVDDEEEQDEDEYESDSVLQEENEVPEELQEYEQENEEVPEQEEPEVPEQDEVPEPEEEYRHTRSGRRFVKPAKDTSSRNTLFCIKPTETTKIILSIARILPLWQQEQSRISSMKFPRKERRIHNCTSSTRESRNC
jgi:hypothetical protein